MSGKLLKFWREASTLMLVSRSTNNGIKNVSPNHVSVNVRNFDYKLLMLERSSKSKFMPSAFVFPGGAISKGDYEQEWIDIYNEAGYGHPDKGLPVVKLADTTAVQSPMFTMERQWPVSSQLAFRITTIRETFEETGILLYQKWKGRNGKVDKSLLEGWRSSIYRNDIKFLEMCRELRVVPDVWSLNEWSNWLTPTNMDKLHGGKRYDTAFFICMHSKSIPSVHDEHEITSSEWLSPVELLERYKQGDLWLAPPQIYEMYRLFNYPTFDALDKYVKSRSDKGCEQWLPVRITTKDVMIAVLPGDDLYPEEADIEGLHDAPQIAYTAEQARNMAKNIHRFEFHSQFDCKLFCNIHSKFNMPSPKFEL